MENFVSLQRKTEMQCSIGLWCNGNTTDSGPVILGSNPGSPTKRDRQTPVSSLFMLTGAAPTALCKRRHPHAGLGKSCMGMPHYPCCPSNGAERRSHCKGVRTPRPSFRGRSRRHTCLSANSTRRPPRSANGRHRYGCV